MSNTERLGPPPPSERRNQGQTPVDSKAFKRLTEVEKISEVDQELKKKKRSRKRVDDEEDDTVTIRPRNLQNPFEALFAEPKKTTDIFGRNAPTYSEDDKNFGSPTRSQVASPPFLRGEKEDSLPKSSSFWGKDPSKKKEETSSSKDDTEGHSSVEMDKKEGLSAFMGTKSDLVEDGDSLSLEDEPTESSHFTSSSIPLKDDPSFSSEESFAPKEKEGATQSILSPFGENKEMRATLSKKEREKKEGKLLSHEEDSHKDVEGDLPEKRAPKTKLQQKYEPLQELAKSFSPFIVLSTKDTSDQDLSKKVTLEAAAQAPTPLPPEILATAVNATTRVAPYVSEMVQNLFTQMVGTVLIMQNQDITTTQVILNSAAFAGSVFENAVITLQKYATAPDSFNIHLTGSTQAVTLFNQNLDSLQLAFREAKLNFRVGKLEASYAAEKPLFKRKEKIGEKEANAGEEGPGQ